MTRHHKFHQTASQTEHVDLGFRDERGRQVGILIRRHEATVVTHDSRYWRSPEADALPLDTVVYGGIVRATRNGTPFGASPGPYHFLTVKEREAYVAKRIAGTRKRYEKKYGGHEQ